LKNQRLAAAQSDFEKVRKENENIANHINGLQHELGMARRELEAKENE
jgi:hypothetical protein